MPTITSKVVGTQFSDYKNSTNYAPGQAVSLVWDRKNPYDKLAVQVFVDVIAFNREESELVRIGYLPKGTDQQIAAITQDINYAILKEYHPEKATHEQFIIEFECEELPALVTLI